MTKRKSVCPALLEMGIFNRTLEQIEGKPNHFLKLPSELRLRVYTHLLAPHHDKILFYHGLILPLLLHPAILRTCKLLHTEGTPVLYRKTLIIEVENIEGTGMRDNTLRKWCRQIGQRADLIREVRLHGSHFCSLSKGIKEHGIAYALLVNSTIQDIVRYLRRIQVVHVQPFAWSLETWMWATDTHLNGHEWGEERVIHRRTIQTPARPRMPYWNTWTKPAFDEPFEKLLEGCKYLKHLIVLTDDGATSGLTKEQIELQNYLDNLLKAKRNGVSFGRYKKMKWVDTSG